MFINGLLAYGCYLLGAALYLLNVIEKYKKISEANPDPDIVFSVKYFWKQEWVNVVKILLIGVATPILLVPLNGISVDFKSVSGAVMFNTSVKVILMPLYLIIGWGGGQATIAIAGAYKKELYNKVGITESKE